MFSLDKPSLKRDVFWKANPSSLDCGYLCFVTLITTPFFWREGKPTRTTADRIPSHWELACRWSRLFDFTPLWAESKNINTKVWEENGTQNIPKRYSMPGCHMIASCASNMIFGVLSPTIWNSGWFGSWDGPSIQPTPCEAFTTCNCSFYQVTKGKEPAIFLWFIMCIERIDWLVVFFYMWLIFILFRMVANLTHLLTLNQGNSSHVFQMASNHQPDEWGQDGLYQVITIPESVKASLYNISDCQIVAQRAATSKKTPRSTTGRKRFTSKLVPKTPTPAAAGRCGFPVAVRCFGCCFPSDPNHSRWQRGGPAGWGTGVPAPWVATTKKCSKLEWE